MRRSQRVEWIALTPEHVRCNLTAERADETGFASGAPPRPRWRETRLPATRRRVADRGAPGLLRPEDRVRRDPVESARRNQSSHPRDTGDRDSALRGIRISRRDHGAIRVAVSFWQRRNAGRNEHRAGDRLGRGLREFRRLRASPARPADPVVESQATEEISGAGGAKRGPGRGEIQRRGDRPGD